MAWKFRRQFITHSTCPDVRQSSAKLYPGLPVQVLRLWLNGLQELTVPLADVPTCRLLNSPTLLLAQSSTRQFVKFETNCCEIATLFWNYRSFVFFITASLQQRLWRWCCSFLKLHKTSIGLYYLNSYFLIVFLSLYRLSVMAALHSRCGYYIFVLWFLLSFFPLSSFLLA